MAYVPDWERLTDALRRVRAATALSKQEAQRDICAAIGDGTIKVRPSLQLIKQTVAGHREHNRYAREIFELQDNVYSGINRYSEPWELHRPFPEPLKGLKPRDLDWPKSRCKTPFLIAIRPDIAPMTWAASIELFSADVTKVLCMGQRGQKSPSTTKGQESAATKAFIGEATFDPSEWITLDEATEILRSDLESSDTSSRWRLMELLRRKLGVARVVTATLPPLAGATAARFGLMPLPDRCPWGGWTK